MKNWAVFTVFLVISISACSFSPGNGGSTPIVITAEVDTVIPDSGGTDFPVSTSEPPTILPTLAAGLSPTELKYRVLEEFPDFFFCDPDFYPVARGDEMARAQERFPELQADPEQYQAILKHNGLIGVTKFTDEQKLLIYRDVKKLNAVLFEATGDRYQFQLKTGQEGLQGSIVTGTIDANGSIEIQQQEEGLIICPICLAAGMLIDTPGGAVRVEELRVGDPVWTQDEAGRRVAGTIMRIGSINVAESHPIIHVTLSDGREVWASPGHPTADNRTLSELKIGDRMDGAKIIQLERLSYEGSYTFDILPSGETGFYWANGILLGSTLAKP